MGKFLQIRVKADTFRPEDLEKAWPSLLHFAWPETPTTPPIVVDYKIKKGVLELVERLENEVQFGSWNEDAQKALQPGIEDAVSIKKRLEAALGDWDAKQANKCSDELETVLEKLESLADNYTNL